MEVEKSYLDALERGPWPSLLFDERGVVLKKTSRCEVLDTLELDAMVASLLVRLRVGLRVEGQPRMLGGRAHVVDAWPVNDGLFVAVCQLDRADLANQTSEAERLTERTRLLEHATRAAGIGFWEMDLKTGWISWDDQLHEIHGLEPGSVTHLDDYPMHLIHPEDADRSSRAMMVSMQTGGSYEVEIRHRWPDGTPRTHHAFGQVVLDAQGMPARALGLTIDVTETRRVEAQLLHAQKLDSIGELAGGVAHDFNNLLTVITSSLDMIGFELSEDDTVLAEFVDGARDAAAHGAKLTEQLLAFARRSPTSPERIDLKARLEGMRVFAERLLDEHVTLTMELGDTPLWTDIDPTSLEQVILNLISNARDAIEDRGEVTVTLGRESEVADLGAASAIALRVHDTGAGIPVEARDRLFEPFFTTKEVGEGTGLGLASCYGIIKRAGGTIALESTSREGTTFVVYLPEVDAPADHDHEAPRGEDVKPDKGDEKLLVRSKDPFDSATPPTTSGSSTLPALYVAA